MQLQIQLILTFLVSDPVSFPYWSTFTLSLSLLLAVGSVLSLIVRDSCQAAALPFAALAPRANLPIAAVSRMNATDPSPRMVAPERPSTRS